MNLPAMMKFEFSIYVVKTNECGRIWASSFDIVNGGHVLLLSLVVFCGFSLDYFMFIDL